MTGITQEDTEHFLTLICGSNRENRQTVVDASLRIRPHSDPLTILDNAPIHRKSGTTFPPSQVCRQPGLSRFHSQGDQTIDEPIGVFIDMRFLFGRQHFAKMHFLHVIAERWTAVRMSRGDCELLRTDSEFFFQPC